MSKSCGMNPDSVTFGGTSMVPGCSTPPWVSSTRIGNCPTASKILGSALAWSCTVVPRLSNTQGLPGAASNSVIRGLSGGLGFGSEIGPTSEVLTGSRRVYRGQRARAQGPGQRGQGKLRSSPVLPCCPTRPRTLRKERESEWRAAHRACQRPQDLRLPCSQRRPRSGENSSISFRMSSRTPGPNRAGIKRVVQAFSSEIPEGQDGTEGYAANPSPAAAARDSMDSQPRSRTWCPRCTSRAPKFSAGGTFPPPSQLMIRNFPVLVI